MDMIRSPLFFSVPYIFVNYISFVQHLCRPMADMFFYTLEGLCVKVCSEIKYAY